MIPIVHCVFMSYLPGLSSNKGESRAMRTVIFPALVVISGVAGAATPISGRCITDNDKAIATIQLFCRAQH